MKFSDLIWLGTAVLALPDVSNPVPQNVLQPVQYRVAFAGHQNAAVVSWNTYGKPGYQPTVYFGKEKNKLNRKSTGDSNTYETSTTWNHHVRLQGLESDHVYYYRVGGAPESEIYHFKTAQKAGNPKEFTFAAAIDWNTMDSLLENIDNFDFLLHPGDLAYADYWLKEELQGYINEGVNTQDTDALFKNGVQTYEALLNIYYQQMQHITSFKPYMVGPGNHESNCDNGGTGGYTVQTCFEGQRNFTGLINHFRMPDTESGGVGPFWYSFDYGLVHFINFNTETDLGKYGPGPDSVGGSDDMDSGEFGEDGEQLQWLKNDLKKVDRSKTPWVIAMGHRPWYVAAAKKNRCLECQAAFEKTFNDYGVDLVLFGHRHLYNRIHPIDDKGNIDPNGLNNPSAPWYIVNGAAGHYDGLDTAKKTDEPWLAYWQDTMYGWSKFTVHNATHLTHSFVISSNNSLLDTQTLYKSRGKEKVKRQVEKDTTSAANDVSIGGLVLFAFFFAFIL
ncbi:Acid phosphatase [Yarrowia sp. C11]|nr:Acid phosphatase [Yarrowia sp. E02]KAG5372483.1 Acid phosphatase [Yarrowia sp. C11]